MWNYYYDFDQEIQLDRWTVLRTEEDGSVRIVCSYESPEAAEKVLLWIKDRKTPGIHGQVLEIDGKRVPKKSGFYIGRVTERQGLRMAFHAGINRIEVRFLPGSEGVEKFRMQLIDIPEKVPVAEYFRKRSAPEREKYLSSPEIPVDAMTPGAGHKPYPGRFGFVKGTGLLDCSMHAFGKISRMYLCGDPKAEVPWAWGYSLIQEESADTEEATAKEEYHVSPLAMRWKRGKTEYLCSTAFPGIVIMCPKEKFLRVSELTFAGNYQYVLTSGEVASTGRFSGILPENWMLLFGSTEYPDVPLLLIPDRKPGKVEFLRDKENRLAEVRLYGCSRLTVLSPFGFEPLEPRKPDDETFLDDALKRCRFWAGASLAVPVACREYFKIDRREKTVRIVQKFEYDKFTDEWGTEPIPLAPLPPAMSLDKEGAFSESPLDFRFPTKYGPLTGRIGQDSEYTLKTVYPYRKFPLKEDHAKAEELLLRDLDDFFDFQSRFPQDHRSYAYPGSVLEGYAFSGTLFNFMPRSKRDLLAKVLPPRMKESCDPDGKYQLYLTDWGYLFRTSPDREGSERYYKSNCNSMEMRNLYDRTDPVSGVSYKLSYLNCSMLFGGNLKDGTQETLDAYKDPCIEIDWGMGCFFYMLYLSALVSGDFSVIRKKWNVLKEIFVYFEVYHDWACMGAGYAEKACTWVEGAGFGAFLAFTNMARMTGHREEEERAVYLTAKLFSLDKSRFYAGPYFAGLYHVEPWHGHLFFQEEYDLYHNFLSVPRERVLSPRERVRKGGLHTLVTEGLYPELFEALRTTSPKAHEEIMTRYRDAYRGGFDAENPPQGRLQCDFSYILVNDALDPRIPPEQTLALLEQAKSIGKFMGQWHDVHRFENNTPQEYLESQINAWLEMRKHMLHLEHWEDLRVLSAEWHPAEHLAEIEIRITGKAPLLRCGIKRLPRSAELDGEKAEWEKPEEEENILLFRPERSGVLRIRFEE